MIEVSLKDLLDYFESHLMLFGMMIAFTQVMGG